MTTTAFSAMPNQLAGLTARAMLLENLLDSCCSAFAVCDAQGNIQYANRAAKRLLKRLSPVAGLSLLRGSNRHEFATALEELQAAPGGRPMMTLRLGSERVQVSLSSLELPAEGWVRLVFHYQRAEARPDLKGFACQYALTPTETRVAEHLASGLGAAEIAETQVRSVQTVRTHIKSLFQKTATHSQAELVALISRNEWLLP